MCPCILPSERAISRLASTVETTGMSTADRISRRNGSVHEPITYASYPSRSACRAVSIASRRVMLYRYAEPITSMVVTAPSGAVPSLVLATDTT
jgi:hypothetical protein